MRAFRQICAETLKKIAKSNRFSSVHMNFLTDEEAFDISGNLSRRQYKDGGDDDDEVGGDGLNTNDYIRKTSLQYHWVNQNIPNDGVPYLSFDDYLDIFKSKRRITIRRERRYVSEEGNTRVDAIVGRDILNYPGLVERMYEIYKSTIDKMWFGNLYLSPEFFNLLVKSDFVESLVFMVARSKDCGNTIESEDIFAGTFNIVDNGTFYGRYWGCLPGHEVVRNRLIL
jgi:predicted N-acyltransferase